jgi:hypothetical protein
MARCIALLAALVLFAGTATAAFAAPPAKDKSSGNLIYQKTTKYIFEDEEIPVELSVPDMGWGESRLGSTFDSLVKPRADFMAEMIKSCEDM